MNLFGFDFELKDYVKKQFKYSFSGALGLPLGLGLLFAFTQYGHIWYIYSSLLSMAICSVTGFWVNVIFQVIKLKRGKPNVQSQW